MVSTSIATDTTPRVPNLANVKVLAAFRAGKPWRTTRDSVVQAGIGDIVVLEVAALRSLVNHPKCLSNAAGSHGHQLGNIFGLQDP